MLSISQYSKYKHVIVHDVVGRSKLKDFSITSLSKLTDVCSMS